MAGDNRTRPMCWTWLSFPGKPFESRHFAEKLPDQLGWEDEIKEGTVTRPEPS